MSTHALPNRSIWWLWLNIFGLDAAIIALIWQEAFSRAFARHLPIAARIALFFAVWMLYLTDRLLDAYRKPSKNEMLATRHQFAGHHPLLFTSLAGISMLIASTAALFLPWIWILMGMILVVCITLYFAWVHLPIFHKKPPLMKEVLVAILFTTGVTLSMIAQGQTIYPAFWRASGLFVALCLVNSLLIDGFSNKQRRRKLAFYSLAAFVLCLIATSAIINQLTLTGLVPAIALSAFLLSLTGLIARWTSDRFASIYCDLVLFTPLLFWWKG